MADYDQREEQNPFVTKRVRYFDNQLLVDQDFIDDQKYHIDRQRRHQRLLTSPGIAEGLLISSTGGMGVKITAGTAMDDLGRTILLESDKVITIAGSGTRMLYILFTEVESDQSGSGQIKGYTRFSQTPQLGAAATLPSHGVRLGTVTVVNSSQLNLTTDGRQYAGFRMPGPGESPILRSAAANANAVKAGLSGNLNVTGTVGIGMAVSTTPAARLEVVGATNDGSASALKISNSSTGLLEIKNSGASTLSGSWDVAHGARTGTHASVPVGLYVTANLQDSQGVEFRQSGGAQGLGFGANTVYAAGSNANQDVRLLSKGSSSSVKVVNDSGSSLLEVRKDGKVGIGKGPDNSYSVDISGDVRAGGMVQAGGTNGRAFQVGDDAAFHDINQGNVVGLYGLQDGTQGGIKLGSAGPLLTGKSNALGINASTPIAALDVAQTTQSGSHPTAIKGLYVTADLGEADGIEFRTSNATQGLGFGYNTVYATGTTASQDIRLSSKGASSSVKVISDSGASLLEVRKDGRLGINKAPDSSFALDVSGDVRSSGAITANGAGGKSFIVGANAALCDIGVANTVGINGLQDATQAAIRIGSSGPTLTGKGTGLGLNSSTPVALLDIAQSARTGSHPTAVKGLYVTGDFGDADGVEIRHTNASQGVGIGANTVYAAGVQQNQDLNLKARGSGKVVVKGNLGVDANITGAVIQANTLTFPAPTGDFSPVITARMVPPGQGASNERTELILFHANDGTNSSGPDTITLRAPSIRLQTYNNASVNSIDNNAGYNERFCIDPSGNISVGNPVARSGFDTNKAIITGTGNDYAKAQYLLSGGGTVTWTGANGRLKWSYRFIAISMEKGSSFVSGYVDIFQPTSIIPAENVWDGTARYAGTDGVLLKAWEALWAVHTVGGGPGDVSFRITLYSGNTFYTGSNWILIAVCNADENSVKLGTGVTIANNSSSTKGSPIPSGVIVMWSGASNNIPDGWALCNGGNGTPNLQDRFVIGAGASYGVNATGGNAQITLNVGQLPPHTHSYGDYYFSENNGNNQGWKGSGDSDNDNVLWEVPNRTTGSTGSGSAIDIRPPYYALAYIMKL